MSTEDEIKQLKDKVKRLEQMIIEVGGTTTLLVNLVTDDGSKETKLIRELVKLSDMFMLKSLRELIKEFKEFK